MLSVSSEDCGMYTLFKTASSVSLKASHTRWQKKHEYVL